jgi:hypothetical protein
VTRSHRVESPLSLVVAYGVRRRPTRDFGVAPSKIQEGLLHFKNAYKEVLAASKEALEQVGRRASAQLCGHGRCSPPRIPPRTWCRDRGAHGRIKSSGGGVWHGGHVGSRQRLLK